MIRLPLDVGCRPSPANITPAFTSSSLNFPISASSLVVGSLPASESLVALTITMNRIVASLSTQVILCRVSTSLFSTFFLRSFQRRMGMTEIDTSVQLHTTEGFRDVPQYQNTGQLCTAGDQR